MANYVMRTFGMYCLTSPETCRVYQQLIVTVRKLHRLQNVLRCKGTDSSQCDLRHDLAPMRCLLRGQSSKADSNPCTVNDKLNAPTDWQKQAKSFRDQLMSGTCESFSIHHDVPSLTEHITKLTDSECRKKVITQKQSPLKGLDAEVSILSEPEGVLKSQMTYPTSTIKAQETGKSARGSRDKNKLKLQGDVSAETVAVSDIEMVDLHESDAVLRQENVEQIKDASVPKRMPPSKQTTKLRAKDVMPDIKPRERKEKHVIKDKKLHDQIKANRLRSRISAFNVDLKSFIDACISGHRLDRAQAALSFYRHRNRRRGNSNSRFQIIDAEIYTSVMRALAKQGNSESVLALLSALRNDGFVPSLQAYCACLESLARQPRPNHQKIQSVLDDLKSQGHVLEELFNRSSFIRDESYAVLQTNPHHGVVSATKLREQARKQLQRELQTTVEIPTIQTTIPPSADNLKMRAKMDAIIEEWRVDLTNAFETNLAELEHKNKDFHCLDIVPYLKLFKPSVYVQLILDELVNIAQHCEHFSPPVHQICWGLGSKVKQKYVTKDKVDSHITDKVMSVYNEYTRTLSSPVLPESNHRRCWEALCRQRHQGPTLDGDSKTLHSHIVRAVGRFLFQILLNSAKVDGNLFKKTNDRYEIPAIYTVFRYHGNIQKEEVKPHQVLLTLSRSMPRTHLTFPAEDLPMLVPPVPWQTTHNGGLLLSSTKLVRLPDLAYQQTRLLESLEQEEINPVLDSLNTLSACPWLINKTVLDIVIKVFKNKGDKSLAIAPPPSEAPSWPKLTKEMSTEQKAAVYKERLGVKQRRADMYSLWCSDLYRLSIANLYRDEIFWFPHNLDFRSRAYPSPPHFNHLGNDMIRGILLFAKGKPLGDKGFDWLKIHLVNLTGLKKRESIQSRFDYATQLMPEILDSADHPLTGRGWWRKSEEPWQTLACCIEVAKASRSPDPSQYVCHFPVHQDGSCNGLQHYAALGRDQGGAESVNLAPFSVPNDVYSDIAELVERERALDAACGLDVAQALEGFIRRKVIKQTIMTTVYGVTRYGAKHQILRQLRDIDDFPHEYDVAASVYIAAKTFYCLQEKFTATKAIQDWFTTCSYLISQRLEQPMQWVTPLGFPIVQPYHKTVTTTRGGVLTTNTYDMFQKPNSMKQKNAFPPNYIHSLDSTHMMLTALHCLRAGICYVSVHDCFWTHPSDVDAMNRITREQFVSLHQLPLLRHLSEYLLSAYTIPKSDEFRLIESLIKQVPKTGSFDIESVLKSTYFFS